MGMQRTLLIEKSSNRTWATLQQSRRESLKTKLQEIANLEQPSKHPKVGILEGPTTTIYRLRVGTHRVIFTTDKGELRVHKVGKRARVYDNIDDVYEAVS